MKTHEPLSSAKAIVGFLVLAIAFVIFYKFNQNQDLFLSDPEALRGYLIMAIVGGGFLLGLLYLVGQTSHKPVKKSPTKSSKKKKK